MNIYVCTKKEADIKAVFPKDVLFLAALPKHKHENGGIIYYDVSGLNDGEIKKTLLQIKRRFKNVPWGIIDPEGSIKDPVLLIFEGASDYLGPLIFKDPKTVDPKRFKTASRWRKLLPDGSALNGEAKTDVQTANGTMPVLLKTGIKFPDVNLFHGWKNLKPGKSMPFFLMYCSLQGKTSLSTRLGEKAHAHVRHRFIRYLLQNFQEAEGLLWMDTGKDFLFLLPPKAKSAEAAVKTCMRMLVSAPISAIEVMALTIPVDYVFALHYGTINYSPPGTTGTVVSDAVNFIFHLGAKKSEPGRLTISDEIPDNSIPKTLEDSFVSAGEYQGRKIWHTKKISYNKS